MLPDGRVTTILHEAVDDVRIVIEALFVPLPRTTGEVSEVTAISKVEAGVCVGVVVEVCVGVGVEVAAVGVGGGVAVGVGLGVTKF